MKFAVWRLQMQAQTESQPTAYMNRCARMKRHQQSVHTGALEQEAKKRNSSWAWTKPPLLTQQGCPCEPTIFFLNTFCLHCKLQSVCLFGLSHWTGCHFILHFHWLIRWRRLQQQSHCVSSKISDTYLQAIVGCKTVTTAFLEPVLCCRKRSPF